MMKVNEHEQQQQKIIHKSILVNRIMHVKYEAEQKQTKKEEGEWLPSQWIKLKSN